MYEDLELYKGKTASEFQTFAKQTLTDFLAGSPQLIQPRETLEFEIKSQGDVHALHADSTYGVNNQYTAVLQRLHGGASMLLFIQESCYWDYTLYEGDQVVDQFSTWPEQSTDPSLPDYAEYIRKHTGNPELLARLWQLPVERIERYLRQWGEKFDDEGELVGHVLTGKAYPTDEYEYGDCRQFFDFVAALGYRYWDE